MTPPITIAPTRLSAAVFAAKGAVLRLRRAGQNLLSPPPRLAQQAEAVFGAVIAESRSALRTHGAAGEQWLQAGKIENLRVACRALDGLVLPAGAVFSIWRHLGPPVRARGYVPRRLLAALAAGVPVIASAACGLAPRPGLSLVQPDTRRH